MENECLSPVLYKLSPEVNDDLNKVPLIIENNILN
jgi:hypothetical protein